MLTFRIILIVVILIILLLIIILPGIIKPKNKEEILVIGGKDFTEQSVLGEIMALLIENYLVVDVQRKLYLGGTMICFNALNAGDLDLYAEYTGTGLVNILDEDALNDPDKVYTKVKNDFKEKYNLIWLKPFGFNNTYTLTMRRQQAGELGIKTFSDLANYLKRKNQNNLQQLKAGFNAEFLERPDGYNGLCKAYNMQFEEEPMQMDTGLMYKACADGNVDIICAFATDGRIAAYGLVALEDDKAFFPPYYAAPLVRAKTLGKYPKLEKTLNLLAGRINNETMQKLNSEVDRKDDPKTAYEAARDFLISEKLIDKN